MNYPFNINLFPNQRVNTQRLHTEVATSAAIVSALEGVFLEAANVILSFKRSLDPLEYVALEALIAQHLGADMPSTVQTVQLSGLKSTFDNKLVVSVWPTEGSRSNLISHNWCDPTTWYTSSVRIGDEIILGDGSGVYRTGHSPVLDLTHGKLFGEDFLEARTGQVLKAILYVNDILLTEMDPDTGLGDYSLDYLTGVLTFTLAPVGPVRISYNYTTDSSWYLQPTPGKVLRIKDVEVQFSKDCSIRDTIEFGAQGQAQYFAPHLVTQGVLQAETYIPLGMPVRYKTMKDFLDEANGSLPITPKTTHANPTWRDLADDVITLPWNYQATINVFSAQGMRIRVKLLNDRPYQGAFATSTFYALSEDEE